MIPVIFDLDGTLVDSAPDIHAAVNRMLAREGLAPLGLAQVQSFVGNGVGVLMDRVMAAAGMGVDPARKAALLPHFLEDYETALDLTRLYPGVRESLVSLRRKGHPLGLCTNKPAGPTRALLAHFALNFDTVVTGDSLAERKPHPAPLLLALSNLGGGAGLFVGDSEVDAECAERAGIPLALFTEGYRKKDIAEMTHAGLFGHHSELLGLVARLS